MSLTLVSSSCGDDRRGRPGDTQDPKEDTKSLESNSKEASFDSDRATQIYLAEGGWRTIFLMDAWCLSVLCGASS